MVNPFLAGEADEAPIAAGPSRRARLLLVASLAAGAVAAGAFYLVRGRHVPKVAEELAAVTTLDAEALTHHAEVMSRLRTGATTNGEAAASIERDCRPRWAEALRRAETLRARAVKGDALPRLIPYLEARSESARLLAEGMRDGDREALDRAKAAWAEAERLGAEFKAGSGR